MTIDDASLVAGYMDRRLSTSQLAELGGEPASRIRKRLGDLGVKFRSPTEGNRLRASYFRDRRKGKSQGPRTPEQRERIAAGRRAWAEKNAVGTSVKPNGYVEHTRGEHKGKAVHVVIMERRLGRPLRRDELVHHIDEDRANNNENNLALMTRAGHSRHHRLLEKWRGKERKRGIDGRLC